MTDEHLATLDALTAANARIEELEVQNGLLAAQITDLRGCECWREGKAECYCEAMTAPDRDRHGRKVGMNPVADSWMAGR